MASAKVITSRKVSFEILHSKLDDVGHLFPSDGEGTSGINFVEIEKLLQNQFKLNQGLQKEEVLRVIDQMRVLARGVVYFPGIEDMENEIKNRCSPDVWEIYQIPRTIVPVLAKLLEYFPQLVRHYFDKSDSDGKSDEISHHGDLHVLRSQLNRVEVDIRKHQCDLSLMKSDIQALKEKLEQVETNGTTGEFVFGESLQEIRLLLKQVEQNRETQIKLGEALKNMECDVRRFKEVETLHWNVSCVIKRIKRLTGFCIVDQPEVGNFRIKEK